MFGAVFKAMTVAILVSLACSFIMSLAVFVFNHCFNSYWYTIVFDFWLLFDDTI